MKERTTFFHLEKFLCKIENENMLTAIQGFNPIHEEIKKYLQDKGLIMEYYIWGDYVFDSTKLKILISDNWKGGLVEGEHFYHITNSDEIATFNEKLSSTFIDTLEIKKDKIRNLLNKNLTSKEQEQAISLILSAKNLKGKEKYLIMKKARKYVEQLKTLNEIFEVNKNFFNDYSKKEQEEDNEQ